MTVFDSLLAVTATFLEDGDRCDYEFCLNSFDSNDEDEYLGEEDQDDIPTVQKDFIGFDFDVIDFGSLDQPCGVSMVVDNIGYEDAFTDIKEELITIAKTVRDECDKPTRVQFLLAMNLRSERVGSYDCEEWDCWMEINRRITKDEINSLLFGPYPKCKGCGRQDQPMAILDKPERGYYCDTCNPNK